MQIKRLDLVKLLVEPPPTPSLDDGGQASSGPSTSTPLSASTAARRGADDRYKVGSELVELAMKSGADDIVHYFIKEKGVMPPLRSIMSMGSKRKDAGGGERVLKRKRLASGK